MKRPCKLLWIVLCFLLIHPPVAAQTAVNVSVNGNFLAAAAYMENGTTFAPLRAIAEAIGARVFWHAETQTASVEATNITAILSPGNPKVQKNDGTLLLSSSPVVKNGTLYVPLRAFSEIFGAEVSWNAQTNTASVIVYQSSDKQGYTTYADSGEIKKTTQTETGTPVPAGSFTYNVRYPVFSTDSPAASLNTELAMPGDAGFVKSLASAHNSYTLNYSVTFAAENILSFVTTRTVDAETQNIGYAINLTDGKLMSLAEIYGASESEVAALVRQAVQKKCAAEGISCTAVGLTDVETQFYSYYLTADGITVIVPAAAVVGASADLFVQLN